PAARGDRFLIRPRRERRRKFVNFISAILAFPGAHTGTRPDLAPAPALDAADRRVPLAAAPALSSATPVRAPERPVQDSIPGFCLPGIAPWSCPPSACASAHFADPA